MENHHADFKCRDPWGFWGTSDAANKKEGENQGTALRNVYVINFEMRCAWKSRNRNVVLDSAHSIHVYVTVYLPTFTWLMFMVNIGTVNMPYMDGTGCFQHTDIEDVLVLGQSLLQVQRQSITNP